jgi:tetratricopeptide (TPR) repeat protein
MMYYCIHVYNNFVCICIIIYIYFIGNVYFNLKQLDKAIEMFEQGLALSPANMALRSNLGEFAYDIINTLS